MNKQSCSRCGNKYPHTAEYFGKDARCKGGLRKVCKPCLAAEQQRKRDEQPERMREISRRAYLNNQERVIAYRNRPDVKAKHYIETVNWRKRNPEKWREQSRRGRYRRRHLERNYQGDVMTAEEWRAIVRSQDHKCLACGRKFTKELPPTVDHVVPISRGGSLATSNVQALCGPCNSRKFDKIVDYREVTSSP